MTVKRCCEVLGIGTNASQENIRTAYHDLVRQWHPDKVAHNPKLQALATEQLKEINAAYETLKSLPSVSEVHSESFGEHEARTRQYEEEVDELKRRALTQQDIQDDLHPKQEETRERASQNPSDQKNVDLRMGLFWVLSIFPGMIGIGCLGTVFTSSIVGFETSDNPGRIVIGLSMVGVVWLLHFFIVGRRRRSQ